MNKTQKTFQKFHDLRVIKEQQRLYYLKYNYIVQILVTLAAKYLC